MTDNIPQLVQRRLRDIDRLRTDAATAIDTLTRALAESQREAEGIALLRARLDRENADFYAAVSNRADKAESTLTAMTQERDAALALASRQSVVLTELGDLYAGEFNRAESATAAAREARAETWASAIGAVEALGESGFFNYAKEKLKAARAGQP